MRKHAHRQDIKASPQARHYLPILVQRTNSYDCVCIYQQPACMHIHIQIPAVPSMTKTATAPRLCRTPSPVRSCTHQTHTHATQTHNTYIQHAHTHGHVYTFVNNTLTHTHTHTHAHITSSDNERVYCVSLCLCLYRLHMENVLHTIDDMHPMHQKPAAVAWLAHKFAVCATCLQTRGVFTVERRNREIGRTCKKHAESSHAGGQERPAALPRLRKMSPFSAASDQLFRVDCFF